MLPLRERERERERQTERERQRERERNKSELCVKVIPESIRINPILRNIVHASVKEVLYPICLPMPWDGWKERLMDRQTDE